MAGTTDAVADVMAALSAHVAQQVAGLGLDVRTELIRSTRVKTGYARANYQAVVGSPAFGTMGAPGAGGGFSEANALHAALSYTLDQGPFYVSNRVPYVAVTSPPLASRGALTITEAEQIIAGVVASRAAATAAPGGG